MMIVFWIIAILALFGFVALAGRVFLGLPASSSGASGARTLPAVPPAADAGREQLTALLPAGDAIVGGPPPVATAPILDGVQPGVAPSVDLNLVGVNDDRDAVDRELWMASKRKLAERGKPS